MSIPVVLVFRYFIICKQDGGKLSYLYIQLIILVCCVQFASSVRGCIHKFPDWPPGARTANGRALCY